MSKKCLLPLFYWAPVQYYTKFLIYDNITIEQYETYPKQTYRNRCELYGANGKQSIQVPVVKGSFHKLIYKDIKISYDTPWQKNHLKTIESAYRSTPFFEYYFDDIVDIYKKKHSFLVDLNMDILTVTHEWLGLEPVETKLSDDYIFNFDGDDYRDIIHPKESKRKYDKLFYPATYMQGFEQRHGFMQNLSIIDLIFNTGNETPTILRNCIVKL